ncbi:hypothetical protein GCM10007160_12270 [Litchfieldella qijiaojingensis]|uniref:Cellulase Ig-like domain-containing protein n=1 Tax=Litchfieldella qijiaojingensis TaxID=980347 RepID=A0ABQ2YJK3_9GAMM|nr:hypothetical protein [Halomonas qijiaojingensis]GGX86500.1 hypothetical protein GCM10007160_12270 [Halomonas qijiaojingensis]
MMSRIGTPRVLTLACIGLTLTTLVAAMPANADDGFHYGPETVDVAAHWAARSTLANAVMFSGLGEPLSISMSTTDDILKHAGYVARPPMPDMATVGVVYAAGDPGFIQTPDFSDPATLRWDPETFDRTLDPAAQAWALIKITSPEFHLTFHARKADKRIALMMLPQAQAQAHTLETKLLTEQGLFAARGADDAFAEPVARDQAIVLWGVSNLILAATSSRDDYWHAAYRDLVDANDYRELATLAFDAVESLPPTSTAGQALAIEALGRYALATEDADRREKALTLARNHADALAQLGEASLSDTALAIYGLTEAGRLLADERYPKAAGVLFRQTLLPTWDDRLGAFATGGRTAYTPETTAAVVAALNAMRWHGPADLAEEAALRYPQFLETVLVHGGLLLSSPLPLVPADYRDDHPEGAFAHPDLPAPVETGVAPVFAGGVVREDGTWHVSDRHFHTAAALFLANMLVMSHEDRADPFLPAERLADLRR